MRGFNNVFASSAVGEIGFPKRGNTPQQHALKLYTEQISGTSFTKKRGENRFTWVYRKLPSVRHLADSKWELVNDLPLSYDLNATLVVDPHPGRWQPLPKIEQGKQVDFIEGLRLFGSGGSFECNSGMSIYLFQANASMKKKCFQNRDGELLIVLQSGKMKIQTEMGFLNVKEEEIFVIPRGIYFKVICESDSIYGYMVEVCNECGFRLPELGPIGANGLANPMDFTYPNAHFDKEEEEEVKLNKQEWEYVIKFGNKLFRTASKFTPFDVVAWRGNYSPYKYDLNQFCVVNSVSFDHLDPSIFTVLTSGTNPNGAAEVDFVIFPSRWLVSENTFRPPYFHRNVMSEFMGCIKGLYDGKIGGGFVPGGISLHNRFTPHGPDSNAHESGELVELKPVKITESLSFMFETCYVIKITPFFMNLNTRDSNYAGSSWGMFSSKM